MECNRRNGEKCKIDVWNLFLLQASFQRSNSHDKVRKIVAEEGRAARNLIAWSVPLENKEEEGWSLHAKQTLCICYYTMYTVYALWQVSRHCHIKLVGL